ncbi:hypothetical protein A9P82_05045 [Arachidicoccus ginsenosidimutans]|uniref:hypothetical protein n=1 Tax=Arachidicoccus sp. BS20 TaxID=1850526 RepID=UPI0007F12828|nr:hypothetical protein [Arachidicoccus sp. BS20]ANI88707.1 hypothetical protein A9P82_05045 [Arachidicoccus sp. BS20]
MFSEQRQIDNFKQKYMWIKLKHQPIKEGDLLIKELDKKDLYNKELMSAFLVKQSDSDNYQLENFVTEPNFGLDTAMPDIVIPMDLSMTYKELVKGNWHLWID